MQKVDLVIGVIGVLALVATGLGVAFYDDGLTTYNVSEGTASLADMGPEDVDASGHDFVWDAPDNAYGASFDVTVTASGQANPSAAVTVTLILEGPDGSEETEIGSFAFSDGSATFSIHSDGWTDIPAGFDGDEEDVEDATTVWESAITLTVVVDGPGASPFPLPMGLDAYTATASGEAMVYRIASDVPEIEAA